MGYVTAKLAILLVISFLGEILILYFSDINECSGSAKCSKQAKCVNIIGSYKCYCNEGYYGDGRFCEGNFANS